MSVIRPYRALLLLLLAMSGCAPRVMHPDAPAPVIAFAAPASTLKADHSASGMNPGKMLLIVVGVFSALLVLVVLLEGTGS